MGTPHVSSYTFNASALRMCQLKNETKKNIKRMNGIGVRITQQHQDRHFSHLFYLSSIHMIDYSSCV
eukprot:m.111104 g.111104  ORF g.111104 m.111104 type:complete len:67 (-) comp12761_c9_seq1:408-608(-)